MFGEETLPKLVFEIVSAAKVVALANAVAAAKFGSIVGVVVMTVFEFVRFGCANGDKDRLDFVLDLCLDLADAVADAAVCEGCRTGDA